jgi:hypothetical protein
MLRNYTTETSDTISFFTGKEIEHTPAYGMDTLFVVGVHTPSEVHRQLDQSKIAIKHIYFGANMSFQNLHISGSLGWGAWEEMIEYFLNLKFLCSLDINISNAEGLLESALIHYHNFIPVLSVKLPYIKLFNYNTTIKIDDKGFDQTNPGVWCHSLHELLDRRKFTNWVEYAKDEIIK